MELEEVIVIAIIVVSIIAAGFLAWFSRAGRPTWKRVFPVATESLEALESRRDEISRYLKNNESTHEFYMALWKIAPYSLVTILLAVVYTYPNDRGLAAVISLIFGCFLLFSVFSIGRVRLLSDRISSTKLKLRDIEDELRIRVEYAKAAFELANLHIHDHYSDYWQIPFSQDTSPIKRAGRYWQQLIGQARLEDMKRLYPRILELMEEMEKPSGEFLDEIQKFCSTTMNKISAVRPRIATSELNDTGKMGERIRSLYVSIVTDTQSAEEVDRLGLDRDDKVRSMKSFFQEESITADSFRELTRARDLKWMAEKAEEDRTELHQKLTNIRRDVKYFFEQPKL